MYKITVKTSGKYHNVVLGARYCLSKKEAISFAKLLLETDADFTIEKFVRLTGLMFAWSSSELSDKMISKIYGI